MASKEVKYGSKIYNISYEIVNPQAENIALFLHGWGANKEIMRKAFGGVLEQFRHIYVDMPGFGASDIFTPLQTKDYAAILEAFVNELKIEPKMIIGHSFGGKVATLMKPEILVLLSSAGIVVPKPFAVRAKIVIFKFFKLLGFGFLYKYFATKDVKGMSQTMYETLKNVVDEDFSYKFAAFKGRAFIFWGADDKATPLRSGEQIKSLITNSEFHALKGDHFFFLLHSKFIDGVITSGLKRSQKSDFEGEVGEVKVISKAKKSPKTTPVQEPQITTNKDEMISEDIQEQGDISEMKQEKQLKVLKQEEANLFDEILIQSDSKNEQSNQNLRQKKEQKVHKIPKQQVFDL